MSKSTNLQRITYRLHAQREKLAPSILLRKNYLESTYLAQIKAEKDAIVGHIDRLQPAVRQAYLWHRLERLNARAERKPIGL